MTIISSLNNKFVKEAYPFDASIHTGPEGHETIIMNLPSGKSNTIQVEELSEMDNILELLSEIRNCNPFLLNNVHKLTPTHFEILSELKNEISQTITVNITSDIDISIETTQQNEHMISIDRNGNIKPYFIDGDSKYILHHIDIENKQYQNKTAKTLDDAKYQLKNMLNSSNEFIKNTLHINTLSPQNTNQHKIEYNSEYFPYPCYTGEIQIDKLNKWVESQGLPFHYIENSQQNNEISLCNNDNVVLANYIMRDEELIDDLNFLNQLSNINPQYIEKIHCMLEEGVVLSLNQTDMPEYLELQHRGEGHIYLAAHDTNHERVQLNEIDKNNYIETSVNMESYQETNLSHLTTDIQHITQAARNIKAEIHHNFLQLKEQTYGNVLTLDDLNFKEPQKSKQL